MFWKKPMTVLAVAATLTIPRAVVAQNSAVQDLTGTWALEFPAPWGVVFWEFQMEQDGETIKGRSVQGMGTLTLDGVLRERRIEFVVDLKDGPHALTMNFAGAAKAKGFSGTMTFDEGEPAEWTLTRVDMNGR